MSQKIFIFILFLKFSDMEQTQKSIIETSKFPVRYNHDTNVPFEKKTPRFEKNKQANSKWLPGF